MATTTNTDVAKLVRKLEEANEIADRIFGQSESFSTLENNSAVWRSDLESILGMVRAHEDDQEEGD